MTSVHSDLSPAARTIEPDHEAHAHIRDVVTRAGSSFYWAMRFLPKRKRDAMFAVYAFCREVDDIVDGDADAKTTDEKKVALDRWRAEIDRVYAHEPDTLIGRGLVEAVDAFDLEKDAFLAIIDGMEMDAGDVGICAPSMDELRLYCARVAGAVGLLSVRIFGAKGPEGRALADSLGEALQITNILRDLWDDEALGRLYLPRDLLDKYGIRVDEPARVLENPAVAKVCADLAETAEARYQEAAAIIERFPKDTTRPARIMLTVYRDVLARLKARGWEDLREPVNLSNLTKLWIAVRHGLL